MTSLKLKNKFSLINNKQINSKIKLINKKKINPKLYKHKSK